MAYFDWLLVSLPIVSINSSTAGRCEEGIYDQDTIIANYKAGIAGCNSTSLCDRSIDNRQLLS
jgi:hypothetical protein